MASSHSLRSSQSWCPTPSAAEQIKPRRNAPGDLDRLASKHTQGVDTLIDMDEIILEFDPDLYATLQFIDGYFPDTSAPVFAEHSSGHGIVKTEPIKNHREAFEALDSEPPVTHNTQQRRISLCFGSSAAETELPTFMGSFSNAPMSTFGNPATSSIMDNPALNSTPEMAGRRNAVFSGTDGQPQFEGNEIHESFLDLSMLESESPMPDTCGWRQPLLRTSEGNRKVDNPTYQSPRKNYDCQRYMAQGMGSHPQNTWGRRKIPLWTFLHELLDDTNCEDCIRWIDRSEGIFKILQSKHLARLWGMRKNYPNMNYDKMSRSLRQYYKKGVLKKTRQANRLVYQFCPTYNQASM